ncbi:MAG: hypothetical protein LBJ73_00100 [Rickettsiales bacterium]|jgi:23S rRNA (adenine2503-C2)-methyltransferase|nr:hypothetical protein [Rickettsiales bacterium]
MTEILFNLTSAELEKFITDMGQPRFRAKQISEWLNRGAPDFASMKNLPESLREQLDATARTLPVRIVQKLNSSDGQTTKFLLELNDGQRIECVLMRTSYGNSVCVSSQAGCAMGCKFCASTLLGLKRNLTAGEMYAQLLVANWELRSKVECINDNEPPSLCALRPSTYSEATSHVVVMGTGEPLQNTENLFGFLERANRDLGIGWRRLTVSTCGIVPGIRKLTEWGRPINLAISLHAPNDELRSEIMPINNKYKISDVLDAAFENADAHNRQLMIEYILLEVEERRAQSASSAASRQSVERRLQVEDIDNNEPPSLCALRPSTCRKAATRSSTSNCTPAQAEELSALLAGRNCMVNLIPWNAVDERDFAPPSGNTVHRFQDILIKNGIHTRIRRERGTDIGSACGQLRLRQDI